MLHKLPRAQSLQIKGYQSTNGVAEAKIRFD